MKDKLKQIVGTICFVAIYAALVATGYELFSPHGYEKLIIKIVSGLMTVAIWYSFRFGHIIKHKIIVLYYYLLYRLRNVKFEITITIKKG